MITDSATECLHIIEIVMIGIMAFIMLELDDISSKRIDRIEQSVAVEVEKVNDDLESIKKELQFTNTLCEKVLSGEW